jgi:hypothetical protein
MLGSRNIVTDVFYDFGENSTGVTKQAALPAPAMDPQKKVSCNVISTNFNAHSTSELYLLLSEDSLSKKRHFMIWMQLKPCS